MEGRLWLAVGAVVLAPGLAVAGVLDADTALAVVAFGAGLAVASAGDRGGRTAPALLAVTAGLAVVGGGLSVLGYVVLVRAATAAALFGAAGYLFGRMQ